MEINEFLKREESKMKTGTFFFAILLFISVLPAKLFAYGNVYAHPGLNSSIVDQFKNRLPTNIKNYPLFSKFKNYYFDLDLVGLKGVAVVKPGNWSITESEQTKTAKEWIKHGGYSADEPEITASLRHFYDPVMNEKVLYLTNTGINPPFSNPCIDAVYWAFSGIEIGSANQWTWNKGKEFMVAALKESDETKKSMYLGKAFRCLGEVLHNTADMGLPAHVRNDAHGGWWYFAGGTDPYESTFKPSWAFEYGEYVCDPDLAKKFSSAGKAEEINKSMAVFTNKYFFSHETISGKGSEEYSSANGFKNYDAPKLQDFEYAPATFGYYKKFPSGREVKMCVDESLFLGYVGLNYRSYPRVDFSCVESQAAELVPAIIEAGINVIRNFIPELEVSVAVNPLNGEVSGNVKHIPDNEYTSSIAYSGEVDLWINGKLSAQTATAKDGKITGKLTKISSGDKVIAKISFADITISSPEIKVVNETYLLKISPATIVGTPNSSISIKALHFKTAPQNVKFVWKFGDGTADVTKLNDSTVVHTFTKAGTYTVNLDMYDNQAGKIVASTSATAQISTTSSGNNFSFSWTYNSWVNSVSKWPRYTVNYGVSGSANALNGNTLISIEKNKYKDGMVDLKFSNYGAFNITFTGSFTITPVKMDTTYADGSSDVFSFTGSNGMSWFTQGFTPYQFLNSNSGTYENNTSFGKIFIDGYCNSKLERYDKSKKLIETITGKSSWSLISLGFDK